MKKVKILLFIALACILVLPFSVFAEGEEETTSSNKEVTLYFFRGEGCSHCAEFESWLEEIEPEYGNLFEVKDYETWYNEDNQKLMNEVAEVRGEEVEISTEDSKVKIYLIPTNEELMIARETKALVE